MVEPQHLQLLRKHDLAQRVAPPCAAFEPRGVLRQLDALSIPSAAYLLANSYTERLPLLSVTGKLRSVAPSAWCHLAPRAAHPSVATKRRARGCLRGRRAASAALVASTRRRAGGGSLGGTIVTRTSPSVILAVVPW